MAWIELSQAARRSGLTTRHLRRLCLTRWQQQGLARPSSRGWQMDESADARFLSFVRTSTFETQPRSSKADRLKTRIKPSHDQHARKDTVSTALSFDGLKENFENDVYSTVDLRSVKERDRKVAFHRCSILHRWRTFLQTHSQSGFNRDVLTQQFFASLSEVRISRGTLYRWDKSYRTQGLAGLLPTHSSEKISLSSDAINAFRELYLSP